MENTTLNQRLSIALSLLLYLLLAYLYFGIGILGHTGRLKGASIDSLTFLWSLHWWAYAFSHHINPFISQAAWAPAGYNVTKTTTIFGLYLLSLPIQLFTSTMTALNLITIFAPAIASWTMYLFCVDIIKKQHIAWFAGYLFGFSTYMVNQTCCHVNLTAGVFLLPIIIWLVVLVVQSRIHPVSAIIAITLSLTLLFLISKEIALTFTLCGTIALIGAFFTFPLLRQRRYVLISVLITSYLLLILFVSPFLYYFLTDQLPVNYPNSASFIFNDLLTFIVPPAVLQFISPLTIAISKKFIGGTVEQVGYIGLPLILIIIFFARRSWHQRLTKYLIIIMLVYLFISLGSTLHIAGYKIITLFPNKWFFSLPLIEHSLANRYSLYVSFPIALITVLWLNDHEGKIMQRGKYVLLGLTIISLLPCIKPLTIHPKNVYPCYLDMNSDITFFSDKTLYRKWLKPNDNVLIIPFNNVAYYQLQTNFYFRVAAVYLGLTPLSDHNSLLLKFISLGSPDMTLTQLKQTLRNKKIDVIITTKQPNRLQALLQQMGVKPVYVGGVWLYSNLKDYL